MKKEVSGPVFRHLSTKGIGPPAKIHLGTKAPLAFNFWFNTNRFVGLKPFLILGLFVLLGTACQRQPAERQYIFLGHPYDYMRLERLDPRVERVLVHPYDQVWFGGDVCARTGISAENLAYLDSLLAAIPGEVHWALGNHDLDFGPREHTLALRQRPAFYVTYADGLCILVLDTNLFWMYPSNPPQENCEEKQAQLDLIRAVTDTVREASHLVVLHHHGVFSELITDAAGKKLDAFNVNAPAMRATCDSSTYLNEVFYPRLVAVQDRGVQVVLVGGDFGMVMKEFSHLTPEGIRVLGSGINNSLPREAAPEYVKAFGPDKVLLFKHQPLEGRLDWEFLDLDSLSRF